MGIVTGYICLICFVLLAGKYVARKTNHQQINTFFFKIHKPVSGIFLLTCIIHFILVLKVLDTRSKTVIASGIISLGVAILLVLLCHITRDGKKKMFWHRMLTIVLLLVTIFHMVAYSIDFKQYQNCMRNIELEHIDISDISDGSYVGEYDAGYIYAKVRVTVESGKVIEIEILEHKNERGQRAESIVDNIIREQRLEVDVISGATNSSLVIEKACENALKKCRG